MFQGSPAVVVYMNEVPLVSAITLSGQGGPGTFVDLHNVQVLAGAQGTLFGRNTIGGAILLTPAKPTNKFEGYVQAGVGNYSMIETEAVLNLPISDKVRLRLVGASRDRDGFTYDVNWNKDCDDQHRRMARAGLWIEPVEGVTNYTSVNLSLFMCYNWTDAQPTAPFSTEAFPDGTVNEPGVLLPSYGLLNATIDWKGVMGMPVDLSLFATNITKKNYIISNTGIFQTIGAQSVIFGEPRMFGWRLRYSLGN